MTAVGLFDDCSAVEDWSDIVAISVGQGQTIGLKVDGTMVTTNWSTSYSARMSDVSGRADIRCP